jgi:hypothetical protein
MTLWVTAWALRDVVAANYLTLVAVLTMVGGYYLFATLIFPDDPSEWPDFDLWYDQHNRLVLGGMLVFNLILIGVALVIAISPHLTGVVEATAIADGRRGAPPGMVNRIAGIASLFHLPLLIALIAIKSRRVNIALLAALIAIILTGALASAIA